MGTDEKPLHWGYWLGLALLLTFLHGGHGLDSDEGVILEGAWGLLHGRELYSDAFQYLPPGAFYSVFWLWKAFGAHYFLAQLLGIFCTLLTAVAIFRSGALLGAVKPASHFGPLLYCLSSGFWPNINHNTFNAAILSWALYFCIKAIASASFADFAMAGLLTGFSMLFLLHKGGMFAAIVLLFLLYCAFRKKNLFLLWHAIAFFLFAFLPLLLLLDWPLPLLVDELLGFPAQHYLAVNRVSPLPLAACLAYTALAIHLLRDRLRRQVLLVFAVQLALLATSLQRTDWSHTLILLFPLMSLIPLAHEKAKLDSSKFMRSAYILAALSGIYTSAIPAITFAVVETPFHQTTVMQKLVSHLDKNCPTFYAGPFLPGLYYEAKKSDPTPFSVLLTGLNTSGQFDTAAAELEKSPPGCAVLAYAMVQKFGYSKQNPVDNFIMANYVKSQTFGDIEVYVLRRK